MTKDKALKLALEALEMYQGKSSVQMFDAAITALREALAQPEQEPRNIRERWNIKIDGDDLLVCLNDHEKSEGCHYERYVPATTAPPKRTWVGLTDEEMLEAIKPLYANPFLAHNALEVSRDEYQAIEAKLKQKNGYAEEKNT